MNKKTGRVVWIDAGIFPIFLGFCPSKAAWEREIGRLDMQHHPDAKWCTKAGMCTIFYDTNGKKNPIIIVSLGEDVERRASKISVIGLLVHEATHVWQTIRAEMGEKEPSREFEAYAMDFIVSRLLRAYSDTRRKI